MTAPFPNTAAPADGRSPSGRATHERSQSPLSSPSVGIPNAVWARLPKASLFYARRRIAIGIPGRKPIWFAKFRLANAMFVWAGPLEIGWRMPWLERSARANHPHFFASGTSGSAQDAQRLDPKGAGPARKAGDAQ